VATCVNDEAIPDYMQEWLNSLKGKQKKAYRNLSDDEKLDEDEKSDEDEELDEDEKLDEDGAGADVLLVPDGGGEGDGSESSGEDEPPTKQARMSADAHLAQVGMEMDLFSDTGRMSRSMSRISRSSRGSSVSSVDFTS
jgi:hypothetical protein